MTDFRALCQELMDAIDSGIPRGRIKQSPLAVRVDAALAQPDPQGPTESDVTELFYRHMGEGSQVGFENAVAEALARWGRPASKSE